MRSGKTLRGCKLRCFFARPAKRSLDAMPDGYSRRLAITNGASGGGDGAQYGSNEASPGIHESGWVIDHIGGGG
jgi:hypothetical protein